MVHIVPGTGLSTHAVLLDKTKQGEVVVVLVGVWGSGRVRSMERIDCVARLTERSALYWLSVLL